MRKNKKFNGDLVSVVLTATSEFNTAKVAIDCESDVEFILDVAELLQLRDELNEALVELDVEEPTVEEEEGEEEGDEEEGDEDKLTILLEDESIKLINAHGDTLSDIHRYDLNDPTNTLSFAKEIMIQITRLI